jgi:hypothetical protein
VLDENEALHHAVKTMQHGEVVVVFYEKLESLRQVLEKYAAQPVQSLSALNGEAKPRRVARFTEPGRRRLPLQVAQTRGSTSAPHL